MERVPVAFGSEQNEQAGLVSAHELSTKGIAAGFDGVTTLTADSRAAPRCGTGAAGRHWAA